MNDSKTGFGPIIGPGRGFRGERSALQSLGFYKTMYFGQFGERMPIWINFFAGKENGFYVDVGAYHPFNISNTCTFYGRGWRGINIEPNPISFKAFQKYRKHDINLNLAAAGQRGMVTFNCDAECSGIESGEGYLFKDRNAKALKVTVEARPLKDILGEFMPKNRTIDFMSVDCEGCGCGVCCSQTTGPSFGQAFFWWKITPAARAIRWTKSRAVSIIVTNAPWV